MNAKGVPQGWAVARIGGFCVERVEKREPDERSVPYIDIGSIDRPTKTIGELEHVTRENAPTRARQWVRAGDVLVSMTRPNLNAVALVPPALDGALASTGFDVLRPLGVLPEWVFNRVRSHEFVVDVCDGLQGVVYPAIRPHDVRQHELPVPPLPEQQRIVEAIESYFTRLDDAMATLERIQRNLKRYRASVLKAAVEGRLVPTEAEMARAEGRDNEPASVLLERILAERRHRWEASGKKGKYPGPIVPGTEQLSELPEGWCWATLGYFLTGIVAGKNFKCIERPPRHDEVGIVKVSAVTWGTFDENESKTCPPQRLVNEAHFIKAGDFLISRANTIELVGACLIVHAVAGRLMLSDKILRLGLLGGLDWWLLWVLRSALGRREIERLATGNQESMRNISQSSIASIRVPVPPEAECRRIIGQLGAQLSDVEHMEKAVDVGLARCSRLRQAILKWAFEGRLADQDPNDEPASVLLARIKAEHELAQATAKKSGRRNARARATA